MTFAIITPALIVGAFPERIKFAPVLVFSGLWLLLVYAPVTHWVWGGGWLMDGNIMDFAGGLVVHATAGSSALVIAAMLGPRDGFPKELRPPHNPGLTIIGAGLLWVGWYGFNGGSALTADSAAGMAIVATHMSASVAGLVWMALEWARFGRPSVVGTVTGVVAGLATVTPASGFVGPLGGCLLGLSGSLVCFFAVEAVKHRLRIDDTLDVFAVHGLGGILGTILVAFLAHPSLQGAGYADGGTAMTQLATQLIGVGVVVAWSVIMTALIVVGIRASIGLRASPDEIEEGLDLTSHGERSYTL
jgi:Amt family ammonium transporter